MYILINVQCMHFCASDGETIHVYLCGEFSITCAHMLWCIYVFRQEIFVNSYLGNVEWSSIIQPTQGAEQIIGFSLG